MVFNFDVRAIWRSGLSLTILATLCIKGLKVKTAVPHTGTSPGAHLPSLGFDPVGG